MLDKLPGAKSDTTSRISVAFGICEIWGSQLSICEMIGRPETHPIKKVIGFTAEMIDAIEIWRAKQRPVPNMSEAIRRLVEIGLKAKG